MVKFQMLVFALCTNLLIVTTQSHGHVGKSKKHVPLFIFGDSIYDAGNNNYINTIGKANYWPYGETFFKSPTGRFSVGRIIPDFIAGYAKLLLIQPYLKPDNHEFAYGVNFASAGAGALTETREGSKLGDEEVKALLSRAVYLFSIGSNDYVSPFETNSSTLRSYSPEEYVGVVIRNITGVIRSISKSPGKSRERTRGIQYSFSEFHDFLKDRMDYPSKYGFEEGKVACCGSGRYNGILSCGGKRGVIEYELCENVSEHVFFDSSHGTERLYQQFAKQFWSGVPANSTGPYSLKELFESNY
ncbi:hypothetical protein ACLB2K_058908 [Fragaria x ananassa]